MAKINGRTYRQAIEKSGAKIKLAARQGTEWVEVCPACDAVSLGSKLPHPYPFLCADGIMRTVVDFQTGNTSEITMELATFQFTKGALESAIGIVKSDDTTTKPVEELGQKLLNDQTLENAYHFSKEVCAWGRGGRVWGNLERHHDREHFSSQILNWTTQVASMDVTESIEAGIEIKGLGVSFASKHLRLLDPARFAVLDEVLSLGLGYALNPAGYKLFIRTIKDFINQYRLSAYTVAEIEFGIFLLIRQSVRADEK